MASVTYDHVVKRYTADLTVVKDFNVEIKDKEFMVLVGPSGCGKSTALRMLAGLEAISEGKIMIGDRVVNNIAAKDRDIAMVFQSYALYPHMSVYDNMAFGLRRRKMAAAEIDRQVRSTAKMLNIEALLSRRPRQLSGGQRQRVALGRAIVRNPAVFLLDEPLSNLDAHLRVQMRAEILKVHRAAHQLDPSRDPGPWLTTIAYNVCRDLWRSGSYRLSRRSGSIEGDPAISARLAGGASDPERDALANERRQLVLGAIARLPEPLRAAVLLYEYEGLSHQEIAEITGIHHAAARKRYSRALAALGKMLAEALG